MLTNIKKRGNNTESRKLMKNENNLGTTNLEEEKTVGFKGCSETCPDCGDKNIFHMILTKNSNGHPSETKFQLKCPSCYQSYDFNLHCEIINVNNLAIQTAR